MKKLELVLFGRPIIRVGGQPIDNLSSSKAQALLFYLAVTGQTHARGGLAMLLWPDLTAARARRNLRVELYNLRQIIPEFLLASRRTVALNHDMAYEIDTAAFSHALGQKDPTVADWETAVALYKGEFLDQFDVRESDEFETWMRNQREFFHGQALEAMFNLAIYYTEAGEYGRGIEHLNQMLTFEPWREEGHQQLMLLLALSGRRGDALRQYELCREVLLREFGAEPGEELTELYTQILEDEIHGESVIRFDIVQREKRPENPQPFMAPPVRSHFVGREETLAAVKAKLVDPDVDKTVTAVVGMGGVGKTTVAVHVAHALREQFADGVLWGNLANQEPESILMQWGQALGYELSDLNTIDELVEVLRGILASRQVLLIVDDVRSVTRLRPILDCAGDRPLLITTRSLELARVLEMQVEPLTKLAPAAGYALLEEILGAKRVAAEPEAAERICTLLQNLPLALEITAQRLKSHPRRQLGAMAARLHDTAVRLSELAVEDQAVRTSFEVSWLTLPDDLKRMFVRVAVFNGRSFTPAAMAHISELDRWTAEDKLFALGDLSLVSFGDDKRYFQHPLLADFAREKLAAAPWHAEPYQKMAEYFYEFAQTNQHNYDDLRPEWGNLAAAIETAAEQGLWQLVLDYTDILTEPWFRRSRYAEAQSSYQLAYQSALQLEDDTAIAKIQYQQARTFIYQGNYEKAMPLLDTSLAIYQAKEMSWEQQLTLYEMAEIYHETTSFEMAVQRLQAAQDLLTNAEVVDSETQAKILYKLADIAYSKSEWDESALLAEKALVYAREAESPFFTAQALRLLTTIRSSQRRYDEGIEYGTEAYALYNALSDNRGMALMANALGTIDFFMFLLDLRADIGNAEQYIQESLTLFEKTGDRRSQAQSLWMFSRIRYTLGFVQEAKKMGEQALGLCRQLGDELGEMMLMAHLGDVVLGLGEPAQARDFFEKARQIAAAYNHPQAGQLEDKLANLGQNEG